MGTSARVARLGLAVLAVVTMALAGRGVAHETMRGPENASDDRNLVRVKEPTCAEAGHDSPCARDRKESEAGDRSYLRNRAGGPTADDTPTICDRSRNDRKAVEIIRKSNRSLGPYVTIKDRNGANPGCYSANLSFNGSGHAAANGSSNGSFYGLGPFSAHGR